jgi:putative intracellular protease/amidase
MKSMSSTAARPATAGSPRCTFILVAHGYEEEFTICCLIQMRKAGLSVSLVGFSAGLVSSLHGLRLRPDLSLEQAVAHQPADMVVVPGGAFAVSALLTDPRVHRLFEATWAAGGIIAATRTAEPVLANQGLLPEQITSSLYTQQDRNSIDFVRQLVELLTS